VRGSAPELSLSLVLSAGDRGRGTGALNSKNRHGRFRESDVFRHVFETVLERCMHEGLVGGEGFAIDASVVKADAARASAIPGAAIDPTVLFGMADFVVGASKSQEQISQLMSAWWLLGCERGYDCSNQSEWIKATCTWDPQCANKPTVIEELQRMNGAKFGDVQLLAEQIGAAVDSGDPELIKKYL
jgi:hypothetical protein